MVNRVSNDSQTDKTSTSTSEPNPVTKSVKSSNSSPESKVQLTTSKSTTKRKQQTEGKNSEKKKAKLQSSEMRTTLEYDGIGLCDNEPTSSVTKEDKILSNQTLYVIAC